MHGHGREEGAGADVEPGKGDAEEPERDERGGIDVDEREDETRKDHRAPDGHDLREATEEYAAEEQFFEDRGLNEEEKEEKRFAAQGKGIGRDELDELLVGEFDVGETGEEFAAHPVESKGDEADGNGGEEREGDDEAAGHRFSQGRMKRRDVASPSGRVALVATFEEGGHPEDEEEATEEESLNGEQRQNRLFVQLHVHSVQELVPERDEAVGEDGVNENRSCREGMERSVF